MCQTGEKMDEVIEKDKGFRKNFIWNIIGTTFNAFNSLFFMIIKLAKSLPYLIGMYVIPLLYGIFLQHAFYI